MASISSQTRPTKSLWGHRDPFPRPPTSSSAHRRDRHRQGDRAAPEERCHASPAGVLKLFVPLLNGSTARHCYYLLNSRCIS